MSYFSLAVVLPFEFKVTLSSMGAIATDNNIAKVIIECRQTYNRHLVRNIKENYSKT